MRHREKMLLGGAAIVALAGLSYWYVTQQKKAAATVPTAALQPGTPVTTLTNGAKYNIAAVVPAGINNQDQLKSALNNAGWSSVTVNAFLPGSGYQATALWSGTNGASVTPGAVVVTT